MNTIRLLLVFLWCCISVQVKAGNHIISLHFVAQYNREQIQLDEVYYPLPGGDSVMFETFRCYISGIQFYKNDKLVCNDTGSRLLDMAEAESMTIQVNGPEDLVYDAVKFNIGVDSITNTSGALGGDLDPAKGMYWAWQTGYINLKLEGKSNRCATRNNAFSFHLGGYLPPYYSMQQITLPATGNDVTIAIPLDKFVSTVNLAQQNSIMIPCKEAVALSKTIAGLFEIKK